MNAKGEILFVKASYRDNWTLPGGVIEEDESPRDACLREVKEEIGLDLKAVKFLAVDYISKLQTKEKKGERYPLVRSWKSLVNGGHGNRVLYPGLKQQRLN